MRGTAFASDFDGTLCESDWNLGTESYDPRDLEAIQRYQAAGGLFGVCTGRALSSIRESLAGKVQVDFYIVTTGAQVLDRDLRPIQVRTIAREVAGELYERYAAQGIGVVMVTDDQFVSVGASTGPGLGNVGSFAEVHDPIYDVSLECFSSVDAASVVCAEVNERFGDVVSAYQNLGSVDIVPHGCSKGTGVRLVREALGVRCIAGIGDSFNDLPMLEAADVAYTFHKSPQSVKDQADCVVSSLAEALDDFCAR